MSSRLAAASHVPVGIVPSTWQPEWPPPTGIVVGIDESDASANAALWVGGTFPEANMQLTRVWLEPALAGIDFLAFSAETIEYDARTYLENTAAAIRQAVPNPDRVTTKLVRGDTREMLLAQGRANDLLVLGRVHEHAIWRVLGGSIAHGVVHHIDTPTVIVPG